MEKILMCAKEAYKPHHGKSSLCQINTDTGVCYSKAVWSCIFYICSFKAVLWGTLVFPSKTRNGRQGSQKTNVAPYNWSSPRMCSWGLDCGVHSQVTWNKRKVYLDLDWKLYWKDNLWPHLGFTMQWWQWLSSHWLLGGLSISPHSPNMNGTAKRGWPHIPSWASPFMGLPFPILPKPPCRPP